MADLSEETRKHLTKLMEAIAENIEKEKEARRKKQMMMYVLTY